MTASRSHSEMRKIAVSFLDEITKKSPRYTYSFRDVEKLTASKDLLEAAPEVQMAAIREGVDRVGAMRKKLGKPIENQARYMNLHHQDGFPQAVVQVMIRLLRRKLPFTDADIVFLVRRTADLEMTSTFAVPHLSALVALAAC